MLFEAESQGSRVPLSDCSITIWISDCVSVRDCTPRRVCCVHWYLVVESVLRNRVKLIGQLARSHPNWIVTRINDCHCKWDSLCDEVGRLVRICHLIGDSVHSNFSQILRGKHLKNIFRTVPLVLKQCSIQSCQQSIVHEEGYGKRPTVSWGDYVNKVSYGPWFVNLWVTQDVSLVFERVRLQSECIRC